MCLCADWTNFVGLGGVKGGRMALRESVRKLMAPRIRREKVMVRIIFLPEIARFGARERVGGRSWLLVNANATNIAGVGRLAANNQKPRTNNFTK
jgi:hypothetical protein